MPLSIDNMREETYRHIEGIYAGAMTIRVWVCRLLAWGSLKVLNLLLQALHSDCQFTVHC